jgi:hypothetical protein
MSRREGSKLLRAALLAWPRDARRESGVVMLDLAQELVDQGSRASTQARGLALAGLGARWHRGLDDLRGAPWVQARPLVVSVAALLVLILAVVDAGSWQRFLGLGSRHLVTPDGAPTALQQFAFEAGPLLLTVALPAIAFASMVRRPGLAAAGIAMLGVLLVPYWAGGTNFGYVGLGLGPVYVQDLDGPVYVGSSIDTIGVVGLLLVVAFCCAFVSALRPAEPDHARGRLAHGAVLWAIAAAVLPWAASAVWPLVASHVDPDLYGARLPYALLVLWFAVVVVFAAACIVPRRAPTLATAAALLGLALVIPAVWTLTLPGLSLLASNRLLPFGFSGPLQFWAFVGVVSLLFTAWVAKRAGAAQRRRGSGGSDGRGDAPTVARA